MSKLYRDNETNFDTSKDNTEKSPHANAKVDLINLPKMNGGFVVDEAEHGGDDDGR